MNLRMRRRGGARGYSLVETAIVLTAFLLVAGGMVYPLSNTWNEQTYKSEKEFVESLRGSIIAYAARSRNFSHRVAFESPDIVNVTLTVPGGRPYLPCPDVNGDGYENRIRKVDTDALITISVISGVRSGVTTYVAGLNFEPGRCVDDKGLLPFRTLGVRANDQWGNHYAYWVDGNFSNSILGFDQGTKASHMFKYAVTPITNGLTGAASGRLGRHHEYMLHLYNDGSNWLNSFNLTASYARSHFFGNGAIIDDSGEVVAGEELDLTNPPQTYDHRHIDGRIGPAVPVHEYRAALNSAIPGITPSLTDYRPMANGIAFAIVSHGPNGHGATKRRLNTETDVRFVCNPPSSNAQELVNAQRTDPCVAKLVSNTVGGIDPNQTYFIGCATGSRCRESRNGIFHVSSTGFNQYDAQSPPQPLNDDIVTWMSASEMMIRLTEEQILPIALPPVALIVPN
ncbi:MAG: hypothetical protein ISN26_04005 [Betaproteobacteria bacterium AqS2]|uniref:Prepilin-type N-terminal cleavage/methylation domain-containing protein n=1 Tax=Candidatus Amphirhobacter heronislandensis TaxID=1732024 RepID=A0A930XY16_9GAMM|nr:hypothetical protein [Betaproteobacteria bacterium AqS2]